MGYVAGAPAIRGGYGLSVNRSRVCAHGNASTVATTLGSATTLLRGCIPQLWAPVHSNLTGVSETDIISNGSSQFVLLKQTNNGVLLRITNDDITTSPSS